MIRYWFSIKRQDINHDNQQIMFNIKRVIYKISLINQFNSIGHKCAVKWSFFKGTRPIIKWLQAYFYHNKLGGHFSRMYILNSYVNQLNWNNKKVETLPGFPLTSSENFCILIFVCRSLISIFSKHIIQTLWRPLMQTYILGQEKLRYAIKLEV